MNVWIKGDASTTLTEAAQSVGSPGWKTLLFVILPNLRSAMLGASTGTRAPRILGPVTRIGLDSDVGPLMADVASARALSPEPGAKVALRVDPAGIRLLPRE